MIGREVVVDMYCRHGQCFTKVQKDINKCVDALDITKDHNKREYVREGGDKSSSNNG